MGMLALALLLTQVPGALDPAEQAAALEREDGTLSEAGRYEEVGRLQTCALRTWEQVARTRPVNLAIQDVNLSLIYVAQGKLSAAARGRLPKGP